MKRKDELQNLTRRALEWRELREQHFMRQIDLAKQLRVSRRTVQKVEAGQSKPGPTTLARFQKLQAKLSRLSRRRTL